MERQPSSARLTYCPPKQCESCEPLPRNQLLSLRLNERFTTRHQEQGETTALNEQATEQGGEQRYCDQQRGWLSDNSTISLTTLERVHGNRLLYDVSASKDDPALLERDHTAYTSNRVIAGGEEDDIKTRRPAPITWRLYSPGVA